MTRSEEPFDELARLAAALCDGEITPGEAARLEQLARSSPAAQTFLLQYLQLHGELYWEHAVSLQTKSPACQARGFRIWVLPRLLCDRARLVRTLGLGVLGVAATLAIVLVAWRAAWVWRRGHERAPHEPAAQVVRVFEAVWSEKAGPEDSALTRGKTLQLQEGLAELSFGGGIRMVLRGPVQLQISGPREVYLRWGTIAVEVPGGGGSIIETSLLAVRNQGASLGVSALPDGSGEVHVFEGRVEVLVKKTSDGSSRIHRLNSGEAIKLKVAGGGQTVRLEHTTAEEPRFVRTVPRSAPGSVAALRRLVASHPHLIHHYSFEGLTQTQQREDKRAALHLTEVVMQWGRGGGEVVYGLSGWDGTTRAIQTHRGAIDGNFNGVALQSEISFAPPPKMTVEALLSLSAFPGREKTPLACGVATRADEQHCGFFLAAAQEGRLVQLFDAEAPWVEGAEQFAFQPGEWYYVATTLEQVAQGTRVNTYVANLTRQERPLRWVVQNQITPGYPATSRLGIGKGFDGQGAHSYPWPGMLDEIALYDEVLDRRTLETHLAALVGPEVPLKPSKNISPARPEKPAHSAFPPNLPRKSDP